MHIVCNACIELGVRLGAKVILRRDRWFDGLFLLGLRLGILFRRDRWLVSLLLLGLRLVPLQADQRRQKRLFRVARSLRRILFGMSCDDLRFGHLMMRRGLRLGSVWRNAGWGLLDNGFYSRRDGAGAHAPRDHAPGYDRRSCRRPSEHLEDIRDLFGGLFQRPKALRQRFKMRSDRRDVTL